MAATLAWLKTNMATIYLAGREWLSQGGLPEVSRIDYATMYSATNHYCELSKGWRNPAITHNLNSPRGEDPETARLYFSLQDAIRTHCVEIRTHLFVPESSSTGRVDDARRLIGEYLAHWSMLAHLADLVTHLLRQLERRWIERQVALGERNIYMIKNLHTVVWKEEFLHVGVVMSDEATRIEMDRAVELLQKQGQDGNQGDKDLAERFLESLRAVGLAAVLVLR